MPETSPFGGLWTQSAVMKVTANGTNTSPVKRGVWVAKRLLGMHIPPPPQNVNAVDPDIRGAKTLREQLELHRSNASCAGCHAKFDPYGFALESFDVTGSFRKNYRVLNAEVAALQPNERKGKLTWSNGLPVDCSGKTPDGKSFSSIIELRQMLSKNSELIARGVTKHLVTYATGTAPSPLDQSAIDAIVKASAPDDYGLRSLVHGIVQSERTVSVEVTTGSRTVKETSATEDILLFGLFRCSFIHARTNKSNFDMTSVVQDFTISA